MTGLSRRDFPPFLSCYFVVVIASICSYNRCSRSRRNFSSLLQRGSLNPHGEDDGVTGVAGHGFCSGVFKEIRQLTEVDSAATSPGGTQVFENASCLDFVKMVRLAREILN